MGMGQLEGLKKYRNLKKDRARMLTVLGEKGVKELAPTPIVRLPEKKKKKKK